MPLRSISVYVIPQLIYQLRLPENCSPIDTIALCYDDVYTLQCGHYTQPVLWYMHPNPDTNLNSNLLSATNPTATLNTHLYAMKHTTGPQ